MFITINNYYSINYGSEREEQELANTPAEKEAIKLLSGDKSYRSKVYGNDKSLSTNPIRATPSTATLC
ncbi:hypothetical protein DICPUDRAFT_150357 [Dictyostelium purpureum]|uniref:Uncharacterized protein n=1 Tax=Dictyostelium purpureum TaxID=5786 RepID=F0ZG44_DICPU|nr:uncharacterized protein DICPUDRAFT_150357 [Dictyostelium purpureum]EGC37095.1 hypothetical protein DICPUDRAFT_150357 [Dictyostelium purpureum]|eukprot:XP_003286376.1 hypothetical protein DICPUDRAFT_150357 [Dictyostelium purpureum]